MTITVEKTERLLQGAIRTATILTILTSMIIVIEVWIINEYYITLSSAQILLGSVISVFLLGIGWMLFFMWYMWVNDNFI